MPGSGSTPATKKPHFEMEFESHQMAANHLAMHLEVLEILRRNGAIGDGIHDVFQFTTSLTSSLSVFQVGTLPHLLDQ